MEDFDILQGKIADLTKTASTPGGISLFTDETKQTYKSTYQLLKEISEIWDELTDKAQAQLLETLAGKRGGQVLAGILGEENFKEVERALQNMEEAAGSADAEMSIVEESISYKLNALRETWVGTLQALVDRGEFGKAVDFLTQISTALGAIISQLGAFGTVIAGSGIVGLIAGIKDFKSIKSAVENIGQIQKAFEGMSDVLGAGAFDGMLTFEDKLPKLVESLGGLDTAQKMAAVSALDLNAEQASLLLIESGVDAETVQQAIDTEVLSVAENKATASTGLLSAALRKLWASYAPFIVAGGIIAGFAAIAAVIYKTKQANDELKKSAKELGDLYSSTKKDISSYKDEVSKLQETLNDESSSYEETKAARERLLAIQDELIEKYGDEREAVNNITEAVQGNIEAFDKLEAQKRVATLNKFNSQNVEGIDWINRLLHSGTGPLGSASNQLEVMVDEMEQVDRQVRFTADDYDLLVQAAEKFSNLYLLGEGGADSRIDIGADSAKELYEELLQLQEFLSSRGASSKLLNDLAKQADDLNDTINQYEDIYNMYILQNRILDRGNYEKHYTDLINEYDKYTEARNKKDEESAEEYKKEIIQTFSDLQEYLDNDGTLEPFEKEGILNFFKNLYPELQSEVSSWQLTVQIQADIETGEPIGETGSIVDKILKFDNEEQLVHQVYASGSELEDIYQDIERYAEDHGVTVQELIDKYRELGLLKDFAYADTNAIAQKYFESNGQGFNSRQMGIVESGLNSLSREDYNTSLLFSDKQWNAVATELENIAGTTDLAVVGAENYAKAVSKVAEEYRIAQEEASKLPTEEKTVAEALKGLKFKDKDDKDITGEEYLDQYYSKMKSIQEAIQGLQNGTLSGQEKTALMQEYNLMSDDVDSMIAELQEFAEAEVNAVIEVIDGLIADNPEDFKLVHALEIIKGYIRDAKDEALGLKSAIGEGATSVNDIQNLKSGMDMIGKIYTDVKDKASFDWSSIINNVEFENTFKSCGEAYDDFIQIIKDSPDDINATQKAFNRLVTQFQRVNSSLYGLKQEDANAAEQMLTDQGVTNAKDLVSWEFGSQEIEEQTKALWENLEARKAVELAKASEIQDDYAREKTIEGINQRYDSEIQHLYDECDALQAATADQKAYYAAKLLANNEGDFTSMSIQQLEAIVRALGMGIDAWKAYYRATKDLEAMNNGTYAYKSQWEWQNKDTLYQMTSNNASAYMNGLADEISKMGKVGGGAVYGGLKDTAGGAGKDAGKSFVDGFDEELSKLKDSYERGEITLAQYLAAYRALIDKYFDDTEANAEDRAKALHDYLAEMKGYYDSAISGVTTLIDYRIKAIQKQKDAAIKALEEERDAALKVYDDQISAIDKLIKTKNKQIKQLEKSKKALDKQKKVYQEQINAIQKANEEREREIQLQKDLYALEMAQNQRTQLVNCIANLHRNVMIIKVAISVKVLWEG